MTSLRELMLKWQTSYIEGPEFSPWPNDPDGGEMRIAAALREALTVADEFEHFARNNQVYGDVARSGAYAHAAARLKAAIAAKLEAEP